MPHVRFNPMIVGAIANALSLVGVPLNERAARHQEKMGMTGNAKSSRSDDDAEEVSMVTAMENTAATAAAKVLAPLARLIDLVDLFVDNAVCRRTIPIETIRVGRPNAIDDDIGPRAQSVLRGCYRRCQGEVWIWTELPVLLRNAGMHRIPVGRYDCHLCVFQTAEFLRPQQLGRLSERHTFIGEWHIGVSFGPARSHPDGGAGHIRYSRGLDPKLGHNGNGQVDGRLLSVVGAAHHQHPSHPQGVGFFSFLVFHNVLSGKRLVGSVLEPLTQCLCVSGIILSIINASRWPKGRCCAPCAAELCKGRFSISASVADEQGSNDDLGDIDLPLTKNKEVELV